MRQRLVGLEALESRQLLAGDVLAAVTGGTLHLTGDDLANSIVVTQQSGRLVVTAGDDTTAVQFDGDAKKVHTINVALGAGDDSIELDGVVLRRDLVVIGATSAIGNNRLHVGIADSQLGSVMAEGRDSDLSVDVSHAKLQSFVAAADARDLDLQFLDAKVTRGVTLHGEGGELLLTADDSEFGRGVFITAANDGSADVAVSGDSNIKGWLSLNVTGESRLTMSDDSRATRVKQITSGGDRSETVLRDSATVASVLQATNRMGESNVRILDEAQVGRFVGSGYQTERNVVFASPAGASLKADVYVPDSAGVHPAVILVHGGGWRAGSKANMSANARALADRGYVAISVDYRLAPANPYPAQIEDVQSAVTWAVENAATYDIDVSNIGLYGYSAGAHLALLAGMKDASVVKTVVAGAPGVDFRNVDADDRQYVHLFGGTRTELPEAYADASPANWISADDPALFLFVGERDNLIHRDNLDDFYASVSAAGLDSELYLAPRKSHLGGAGDSVSRFRAMRFLDARLKVG